MASRAHFDRSPAARSPAAGGPASARHPGLPGWRPLLAAVGVVAVLALVLHLLYF